MLAWWGLVALHHASYCSRQSNDLKRNRLDASIRGAMSRAATKADAGKVNTDAENISC